MKLLINKTDVAKYRQISKKRDDDLLEQEIMNAQVVDLQEIVCPELYNELTQGIGDHELLLNGGTYEYSGVTYQFEGLKAVLVFFAYARYVRFSSNVDTAFDYVNKLNEQSQTVSQREKEVQYTATRQVAMRYWDACRLYMSRSGNYSNECCGKTTGINGFKISKIG